MLLPMAHFEKLFYYLWSDALEFEMKLTVTGTKQTTRTDELSMFVWKAKEEFDM